RARPGDAPGCEPGGNAYRDLVAAVSRGHAASRGRPRGALPPARRGREADAPRARAPAQVTQLFLQASSITARAFTFSASISFCSRKTRSPWALRLAMRP